MSICVTNIAARTRSPQRRFVTFRFVVMANGTPCQRNDASLYSTMSHLRYVSSAEASVYGCTAPSRSTYEVGRLLRCVFSSRVYHWHWNVSENPSPRRGMSVSTMKLVLHASRM